MSSLGDLLKKKTILDLKYPQIINPVQVKKQNKPEIPKKKEKKKGLI